MIVAVTGHRPQRLKGQEKEIKEWATAQLRELQPESMYNGMAQGADQITALAAKEVGVPIVCCYPYQKSYSTPTEDYIKEGNEVIYISPCYFKECFSIRDRYMVDHCDVLLAVWDGKPAGGTFQTREYAKRLGKQIIDYEGLRDE